MRSACQPAILAPVPPFGRLLELDVSPGRDPRAALRRLAAVAGELGVIGLGAGLVAQLGGDVPGLRPMPALVGAGASFPSTPRALLVFAGGDDASAAWERGERARALLADAFELVDAQGTWTHRGGRDLSGYEDGTENPTGDAAVEAAVVDGAGAGLDGASFVAVQRWSHSLDVFSAMPAATRDAVIGRRLADNEELDDAPESAHVKRSAQERFTPPAFMLRRSMPWSRGPESGLMFVAYGRSFDAFEQISRRMLGLDDGVVDALFTFTRPRTGAYFWCPPALDGRLDLSRVGVAAPARGG